VASISERAVEVEDNNFVFHSTKLTTIQQKTK
jgi:hypothetical protein